MNKYSKSRNKTRRRSRSRSKSPISKTRKYTTLGLSRYSRDMNRIERYEELRRIRREAYLEYTKHKRFLLLFRKAFSVQPMKTEEQLFSEFTQHHPQLNNLYHLPQQYQFILLSQIQQNEQRLREETERIRTAALLEVHRMENEMKDKTRLAILQAQEQVYQLQAKHATNLERMADRMDDVREERNQYEKLFRSVMRDYSITDADNKRLRTQTEQLQNTLAMTRRLALDFQLQRDEVERQLAHRDADVQHLQDLNNELNEKLEAMYYNDLVTKGINYAANFIKGTISFLEDIGQKHDEELKREQRERRERMRARREEEQRQAEEMKRKAEMLKQQMEEDQMRMEEEMEREREREQREREQREREQREREQREREQREREQREREQREREQREKEQREREQREREQREKEQREREHTRRGRTQTKRKRSRSRSRSRSKETKIHADINEDEMRILNEKRIKRQEKIKQEQEEWEKQQTFTNPLFPEHKFLKINDDIKEYPKIEKRYKKLSLKLHPDKCKLQYDLEPEECTSDIKILNDEIQRIKKHFEDNGFNIQDAKQQYGTGGAKKK